MEIKQKVETSKVKTTDNIALQVQKPLENSKFQGNDLVPALWTITPAVDGVIDVYTDGSFYAQYGTLFAANSKINGGESYAWANNLLKSRPYRGYRWLKPLRQPNPLLNNKEKA